MFINFSLVYQGNNACAPSQKAYYETLLHDYIVRKM